jgi:Uma2 family endonuclease
MSERPSSMAWTWDDMAWEAQQGLRRELVGGQICALGGGTAARDVIANTMRGEIGRRLEGHRSRLHGPDTRIHTTTDHGRYPEALIDRGRFVSNPLDTQEPTVVFEVLSRSRAWVDQGKKLHNYSATRSTRQFVLISQDEPRVMVYRRGKAVIRTSRVRSCRRASMPLSNCQAPTSPSFSRRFTLAWISTSRHLKLPRA